EEEGAPGACRLGAGEGEAGRVPPQVAPPERIAKDLRRLPEQVEEPAAEEDIQRHEIADAEMDRAPGERHRRERIPGDRSSVEDRAGREVERQRGECRNQL